MPISGLMNSSLARGPIREVSIPELPGYRPGARIPAHVHTGYEHIFIISGSQIDQRGSHVAGTLIINPPGSGHDVHSPEGCTVLAIWERPVQFLGNGHEMP